MKDGRRQRLKKAREDKGRLVNDTMIQPACLITCDSGLQIFYVFEGGISLSSLVLTCLLLLISDIFLVDAPCQRKCLAPGKALASRTTN